MPGSAKLRLAMAQVNPTVGDLAGNSEKIAARIHEARQRGADLVLFPELALTGYPPEDLLLKPAFVEANLRSLEALAGQVSGITAIVGFVDSRDDIYNAAAILGDGVIRGVYHKRCLPNYGVFDEFRYFQVGRAVCMLEVGETRVGISICEDIWYPDGPVARQLALGAEVVLNISSSPYHAGKRRWRERMLATRAADGMAFVAYLNLVGGQDELVFDGDSLVFGPGGDIVARGRQFEEDLIVTDLDLDAVRRARLRDPKHRQNRATDDTVTFVQVPIPAGERAPIPAPKLAEVLDGDAEVYRALVTGTRDYVLKNGFRAVVLGLSGGIDSALTAAVAVDALGNGNVVGVLMPSEFSSEGSIGDSERLGERLGIRLIRIPIRDLMGAYDSALGESFGSRARDVTEENLQARIRGNLVMALSNKFGWMVLSTGNKSELSVGYCTLYGDMAGGFAVLKDVTKTMVYRLARYRNQQAGSELVPAEILGKPPSAELRPDQKDTDSLPPYEVLDPVLEAYIEDDRSLEEIVARGFDPEVVARVIALVDGSEYKRRQAAPGVKITPRAFGRDRRMPITSRFRT